MDARALSDDRRGVPVVGLDWHAIGFPVGPAAHYVMGGVETDLWGRTTLPGLYAAARSRAPAFTAPIARQQLAARGLVFGARAAQAMLLPAKISSLLVLHSVDGAGTIECDARCRHRRYRSDGSRGAMSAVDVELGGLLARRGAVADGRRGARRVVRGAWRRSQPRCARS
jgi:hypothetical protein